MKKFLKGILSIGIVVILMCLVSKLGTLGFSISAIDSERLNEYSAYYYNQLAEEEKRVYIKIDEAIKDKEKSVTFTGFEVYDLSGVITKILNAYFYDNPSCFYISNKYIIANRDLIICEFTTINFEYAVDNAYEIDRMSEEMTNAIHQIIRENINSGMTDFEKELALHDALLKKVVYYEYEDINTIPLIKHTAYGALVQNEAVCDGYAKAFSLLLEQVGIESTIISGKTGNIAHAWNVVKLDNEWYHVDVTSDTVEDNNKQYLMHKYFNITDKEIKQTHSIDDDFKTPECNSTKYDYYIKMGCYINYEDNLYTKLKKIVKSQSKSKVLEVKADGRYNAKSIIDALYDIDFNNWHSSYKTSVSYNKMQDVYVFIK